MNKMDKPDANFEVAVRTIKDKLNCQPLLMQIPLRAATGDCIGIIDLVNSKVVTFEGSNGEVVSEKEPTEEYVVEALNKGRKTLITFLAEHSSQMMETYLDLLDAKEGDESAAE